MGQTEMWTNCCNGVGRGGVATWETDRWTQLAAAHMAYFWVQSWAVLLYLQEWKQEVRRCWTDGLQGRCHAPKTHTHTPTWSTRRPAGLTHHSAGLNCGSVASVSNLPDWLPQLNFSQISSTKKVKQQSHNSLQQHTPPPPHRWHTGETVETHRPDQLQVRRGQCYSF